MVGWMDSKLVLIDINVETPVGWLDDPKKWDIRFKNRPLDGWMAMASRRPKSDTYENPVG